MASVESFADRAANERRRARRNRILSVVFFVLAGLVLVGGVTFTVATGKPNGLSTVTTAFVIGSTAVMLRLIASMQDDNARRFDRLARGGH